MPIDSTFLRAAITQISGIQGIVISPEALMEDVVLLASAWPDEPDFISAVSSTIRALTQACDGRITADPLQNDLNGWFSYHYQLRREQGMPAELRLVFRPLTNNTIEIKGFGHRFRPADLYRRFAANNERNAG